MQHKRWLEKGSIAVLLGFALASSATAQTGGSNSDVSGTQTFSAPSVSVGTSGISANISGISGYTYNPATGNINFFSLSNGLSIAPGTRFGSGGAGLNGSEGDSSTASDSSDNCAGELCQEQAATETQEITLNEIAELLELDLDRSLEQLALAEDEVQKAEAQPRRIVRRDTQQECVNPYIRARDEVDRKLEQSRKFIELVDPIKPENGMW